MVDPDEVEQVEGAPQPLDPPPVAVVGQHVPPVQRVAPQLAGRGIRVRWHAGDRVVTEELRPGPLVRAARGDVDGHVTHEPHATGPRVLAQRRPLAREPHLVLDAAAVGGPRAHPVGLALDELVHLAGAHRGVGLLEQRGRGGEG